MTKKMGKPGLVKALHRFVRADLLKRSEEFKDAYQPSLYQVTDMGLRLLEIAPGNKKNVQYVVGGNNGV